VTRARQPHSVLEILTAIATVERVSETLRGYPERDHAIEILEDELAIARVRLVGDLRAELTPHTRNAVAVAA
jgi:hypothetical protein